MSSPLHIAHLVNQLNVGGLETILAELVNGLPQEETRHSVIALTTCGAFQQRFSHPRLAFYSLNKQPGKDWLVWVRLWRLLRQLQPDLLHSCNISTLEGTLPALLAGVRLRFHAEHGRDIYDLHGQNRRYRLLRRLYAPLVTRFVPVSRELEHWLLAPVGLSAAKVWRINNGIDTERFQPVPKPSRLFPPSHLVIGTIGRLAAVKDHATLLHAFQLLVHRRPQQGLHLVVVGDGPLRGPLEALAQQLGVSDQVLFVGEQADVRPWLAELDLFVLSSLAEGVPLTLLEAMAMGRPVVATRVGDCPTVLAEGQCGLLVPAAQPQALASALEQLLQNPPLAQRLGQAARQQVVTHFALTDMIQNYWRLFTQDIKLPPE